MAYIKGEKRDQLTLIPLCLDDYVEDNNICRVIDVFVRSLDMTGLGFKYAPSKRNRQTASRPGAYADAVHLRLTEPHPFIPPP